MNFADINSAKGRVNFDIARQINAGQRDVPCAGLNGHIPLIILRNLHAELSVLPSGGQVAHAVQADVAFFRNGQAPHACSNVNIPAL